MDKEYERELWGWHWDREGRLMVPPVRGIDFDGMWRRVCNWALRAVEIAGVLIALLLLLTFIIIMSFLDWVWLKT